MITRASISSVVALVTLTGCAREPERMAMASAPPRVVTKTVTKEVRVEVPVCPTDDQLRDSAIEVSMATYRNAPGGSRTCACPTETYKRLGIDMSCGGNTAVQAASWVMCRRDQVPDAVIASMRTKLASCAARL